MKTRHVLFCGLILIVATLLAIFAIDGGVASAVAKVAPAVRPTIGAFTAAIEVLFLFPLSKFAAGAVVLLASIVFFFSRARRSTAWLLLFVSLTQLSTRLIAGVLKNVFARARPFEAFTTSGWHDRFFVEGGSSFPSGHAAHFWGFYFAVAIAFPRYRIPFLILALLVSIARVLVNDHYVSDVLASAAIAALVACCYALILIPRSVAAELRPAAAL